MTRRLALAVLVTLALAAPAHALEPATPAGVGVDEHPGAAIPLDLRFTDAQERPQRLGDLFRAGRPVVLVLAYARCELLCSTVLESLARAAADLPLLPGRDYQGVVVSLDPRERPIDAAQRQATMLARVGHGLRDPARWPFLVGDDATIHRLAAALGFRYTWDERTRQYAHPAVVFVLTPDGRIARYLHGVGTGADELGRALRLAAAGVTDRAATPGLAESLLRCFRFESAAGRYGARLALVYRGFGLVLLVLVVGLVGGLVRLERRRRQRA